MHMSVVTVVFIHGTGVIIAMLLFCLLSKVNRQEQSTGKPWKPGANSRVCSRHFTDGKPTTENPDPCLLLGMLLYNMINHVYHHSACP